MKVAVLISGGGSNLQALIDYENTPIYPAKSPDGLTKIELVIADSSNKAKVGLKRAKDANIPTHVVDYKKYKKRITAEKKINELLIDHDIELVVLAGFMKILSPAFVNKWKGKLINLHPSLLPSFPGTTSIKDAYEYGVKITGVTVHYVDEGMDTGSIIEQVMCRVEDDWSLEDLENKMHWVEHQLLPKIVRRIAEKNIDKPE